ncbi:hypothetical protein L204_103126 [Cryptococcus depauperatus]
MFYVNHQVISTALVLWTPNPQPSSIFLPRKFATWSTENVDDESMGCIMRQSGDAADAVLTQSPLFTLNEVFAHVLTVHPLRTKTLSPYSQSMLIALEMALLEEVISRQELQESIASKYHLEDACLVKQDDIDQTIKSIADKKVTLENIQTDMSKFARDSDQLALNPEEQNQGISMSWPDTSVDTTQAVDFYMDEHATKDLCTVSLTSPRKRRHEHDEPPLKRFSEDSALQMANSCMALIKRPKLTAFKSAVYHQSMRKEQTRINTISLFQSPICFHFPREALCSSLIFNEPFRRVISNSFTIPKTLLFIPSRLTDFPKESCSQDNLTLMVTYRSDRLLTNFPLVHQDIKTSLSIREPVMLDSKNSSMGTNFRITELLNATVTTSITGSTCGMQDVNVNSSIKYNTSSPALHVIPAGPILQAQDAALVECDSSADGYSPVMDSYNPASPPSDCNNESNSLHLKEISHESSKLYPSVVQSTILNETVDSETHIQSKKRPLVTKITLEPKSIPSDIFYSDFHNDSSKRPRLDDPVADDVEAIYEEQINDSDQWRVGKRPGHQGSHSKLKRSLCQSINGAVDRVLKKPFRPPTRITLAKAQHKAPSPSHIYPIPETCSFSTPSSSSSTVITSPATTATTLTEPMSSTPSSIRSHKLSKPFKTPVRAIRSDAPSPTSVFLLPSTSAHKSGQATIITLQNEVILLRKAVKYDGDNSEQHLHELISTWRSAGREMVERLYNLVPRPINNNSHNPFVSPYTPYSYHTHESCYSELTPEQKELLNKMPKDKNGDVVDDEGNPLLDDGKDQDVVKFLNGLKHYGDDNSTEKSNKYRAYNASSQCQVVDSEDMNESKNNEMTWDYGALMRGLSVDPHLLGWDDEVEDWIQC